MILGSGVVHSLRIRLRAQEWLRRHPEIADEVVDDPVVVVGMMRSGTTLAQRLLAADPAFQCALRLGGARGRAAAGPRLRGHRPADRGRAGRARSRPAPRARPVRDPPDARAGGRGGDRLPRRRVPLPRARSRARTCRRTAAGSTPRTSRRPTTTCTGCCSCCSGRSGSAASRRGAGCSRPRPTWATSTRCARGSPACRSCTCTATRGRPSPPAPASTRSCTGCTATTSTRTGSVGVAGADGVDQRPRRGHARSVGARPARRRPGVRGVVRDPLGEIGRVYDALGLALTADGRAAMRDWLARRPREAGRPAYDLAEFGLTADAGGREIVSTDISLVLRLRPMHPVATAEQHAHELAALELVEHPTVQAARAAGGRDLAVAGQGVGRDARAVRRGVRRGDVLRRGVVVQPGPAAAQVDLHHPARAPGRGPAGPGLAVGHRQPRHASTASSRSPATSATSSAAGSATAG